VNVISLQALGFRLVAMSLWSHGLAVCAIPYLLGDFLVFVQLEGFVRDLHFHYSQSGKEGEI
jgi:hypothetical protein